MITEHDLLNRFALIDEDDSELPASDPDDDDLEDEEDEEEDDSDEDWDEEK